MTIQTCLDEQNLVKTLFERQSFQYSCSKALMIEITVMKKIFAIKYLYQFLAALSFTSYLTL